MESVQDAITNWVGGLYGQINTHLQSECKYHGYSVEEFADKTTKLTHTIVGDSPNFMIRYFASTGKEEKSILSVEFNATGFQMITHRLIIT